MCAWICSEKWSKNRIHMRTSERETKKTTVLDKQHVDLMSFQAMRLFWSCCLCQFKYLALLKMIMWAHKQNNMRCVCVCVHNEFSRQWRYRLPILILVNTKWFAFAAVHSHTHTHTNKHIEILCRFKWNRKRERNKDKTLSDKIIAAYKFFAYVILVSSVYECGVLSFSFPRVFGLVITIFFSASSYCCCCCLVHWKATRSRNSSVVVVQWRRQRQQQTTFPYSSLEMAGCA